MDLLIKQVRLQNGKASQGVAIREGKIIEIAPIITGDTKEVIEAGDRILVPGFVGNHLHLDKTLIADRRPNKSGALGGAIEVTAELKPTFTEEDIYDRAKHALEISIVRGATALGTHAKPDPAQGFTGFKTVMRLKEEYKELVDMQTVTFPQEGIFKTPGIEQMVYEMVDMGADVVGGILYSDAPAKKHINLMFEIARKYDKDVDLRQDLTDETDDTSIKYLCRKTIVEGYQGRVSMDHLTALHTLPKAGLAPIIAKMAETNIGVMALPATSLHLGTRGDQCGIRRAVTPVHKLRDDGMDVCVATNNIRSAFTPYGAGDIVQTTMLAIPVGHLGGADDLKTVLPVVITSPARVMGLGGYGIAAGSKTGLVLLDTKVAEHAIVDVPEQLYAVKNGRATVKTGEKVEIIR